MTVGKVNQKMQGKLEKNIKEIQSILKSMP